MNSEINRDLTFEISKLAVSDQAVQILKNIEDILNTKEKLLTNSSMLLQIEALMCEQI
jgi:hypothetical protein